MMKILLNFFIMLFLISCGQSQNKNKINNTNAFKNNQLLSLNNTIWEWKIAEDCINYLEFEENGIYQEYNCELGEKWEGEYQINADTLILMEKIYTSDAPGQGENVVNEYRMILTSQGLSVIYSHVYEDGNWNENWIREPNVYFKKVE
ncbi:MAG: hypothetical protein K8R68_09655 [Bacteroidales bacterium]|nr:hypothetical protein [Bacteroidales bacterium]